MRLYIGRRVDRSPDNEEFLVVRHDDGAVQVARRPDSHSTWSPPTYIAKAGAR